MVAIGLRCSPDWLCDGIAYFFGLMFIALVVGLIWQIYRQR